MKRQNSFENIKEVLQTLRHKSLSWKDDGDDDDTVEMIKFYRSYNYPRKSFGLPLNYTKQYLRIFLEIDIPHSATQDLHASQAFFPLLLNILLFLQPNTRQSSWLIFRAILHVACDFKKLYSNQPYTQIMRNTGNWDFMRKQKIAISHFTAQSRAYIHGLESQSPTLFISLWIILTFSTWTN